MKHEKEPVWSKSVEKCVERIDKGGERDLDGREPEVEKKQQKVLTATEETVSKRTNSLCPQSQ